MAEKDEGSLGHGEEGPTDIKKEPSQDDTRDGETLLKEAVENSRNGRDLYNNVVKLPLVNARYGRSFVMNRILRELRDIHAAGMALEVIDKKLTWPVIAKKEPLRKNIEEVMSAFSDRVDDSSLRKLKAAALQRHGTIDLTVGDAVEPDHRAARKVDTIALLSHVVVDTACRPLLEKISHTSSNAEKLRGHASGATPADLRAEQFAELAAMANAHAGADKYSNPFDPSVWKELKGVDPARGHFVDGKEFAELWTKMKNQFDVLMASLQHSGEYDVDIDRDIRAVSKCKTAADGRSVNILLLYCYLMWRDKELSFVSNALAIGIGMSTGLANWSQKSSSSARGEIVAQDDGALPVVGPPSKKRQKKNADAVAFAEGFSKVFIPAFQEGKPDKALIDERTRSEIDRNQAQTTFLHAQASETERTAVLRSLREAMESAAFKLLSEEDQRAIANRYASLLLLEAKK